MKKVIGKLFLAALAWDPRCYTVDPTTNAKIANLQGLECIMKLVLNNIAQFAGIAAFIVIIAGGFQYLTSGGNPEKTKKARATLTWGIVGLAALILSWFILKLINAFTGLDLTVFTVPGP